MPKTKTLRTRRAPVGFDDIEPALLELENRLRDAVSASHEGKRKNEATWEITKIEHQRNRYIYELYFRQKKISKDLYVWLIEEGYVSEKLISKWRKPGYERLCCLRCIQTTDTNHGTTCICRVPSHQLSGDRKTKGIQCTHCGCRGCASGDQKMTLKGSMGGGSGINFNQKRGQQLSLQGQQQALMNGGLNQNALDNEICPPALAPESPNAKRRRLEADAMFQIPQIDPLEIHQSLEEDENHNDDDQEKDVQGPPTPPPKQGPQIRGVNSGAPQNYEDLGPESELVSGRNKWVDSPVKKPVKERLLVDPGEESEDSD